MNSTCMKYNFVMLKYYCILICVTKKEMKKCINTDKKVLNIEDIHDSPEDKADTDTELWRTLEKLNLKISLKKVTFALQFLLCRLY